MSSSGGGGEPTELEQLFDKLQQAQQQQAHSRILRLADQILKLAPGDADALACKAVANLQLGEYEAADRVLAHASLKGRLQFERAYCCYRLNKFDEALKLLASVGEEQESGALQLAAQVHFRLDNSSACMEAYDKLKDAGKVRWAMAIHTHTASAAAGDMAWRGEDAARSQPSLAPGPRRLARAPHRRRQAGSGAGAGAGAGWQLAAAHPGNANVTMLQAVLLAKHGKAAEADALLASSKPSSSSAVDAARPTLLRAQLALEAGNTGAALQLLSSGLPAELQMRPAVLATRVALHEQTGDLAGAEALLQAGLKHWQAAAAAKPRDAAAVAGAGWCLQRLVSLKVAQGAAGEAMALYLQLGKLGGAAGSTSTAALAKLARAAAAAGDADAVAVLQKQLPAAYASLGSSLDLDALEDSARAAGSSRRREEVGRKRDAEEEEAVAGDGAPRSKRAKKRRKPRLPKGYDPTKPNGGLPPPDPERWLPKWQRSDAKKKARAKRRDRTETVKGSQGAGKVDEALDRAAKAERGEDDKPKGPAKPQLPARAGKGKGGRR